MRHLSLFERAPAAYVSGANFLSLGKILVTWGDLGQEQGNGQNQKELHELWIEIGGF